MKVLLISPNIKGISKGVNRIQPPLGIAYLAAYLQPKHEVIVYDTAIEGWDNLTSLGNQMISLGESPESIEAKITAINPDVVGISVLFSNLMDSALEIAAICKKINPQRRVVCGGNYITNTLRDWQLGINSYPRIQNKHIDYYFSGEAELTFLDFLNRLNTADETKVAGLSYFEDGRLVTNAPAKFMEITNCLDPAWELFNMEKYFSVGLFHSAQSYSPRVLPVMASRGCPEKCQFCTTPLTWGASVRWKDPANLYLEMKRFINQYDIKEIQFQDDTITANLSKLYKLCDYMKEFKLPWCTPNGIKLNYHSKEQPAMFTKMKQSGCYQITLACESGSQRVLDTIIRKNIQISQLKQSVQAAKEAGLFVHTFWIVGLPGETFEEMQQTIDVAANSGADSFSLSILTPLPGTPIYHKVVKENLWWDADQTIQNSLFRNSLIQVDGFDSPEEFESWVCDKNIYLNSLLEIRDAKRYMEVNLNRGVRLDRDSKKLKQT